MSDVAALQATAIKAGRVAWERIEPAWIVDTWRTATLQVLPVLESAQVAAATSGASYGAAAIAEQGAYVAPRAWVNPQTWAGFASDGRPLVGLLQSPAYRTLTAIKGGMSERDALGVGRRALDKILHTQVGDAGRTAAGVDIAARPGVGYVRMLVGTSCPDCLVLAGRFYRWNAGFRRHPHDDCVHVPSPGVEAARAKGYVTDPYEHFEAMSREEQDAFWGAGSAQAIRDGADIYRVGNARRGAKGMVTTEGTSKRGYASDLRGRRLTPEGIYAQATSRDDALRLLEEHRYVLPGGQTAGGVIRGADYEGYGSLGRGGTRVGMSSLVEQSRATGVQNYATLTAAQRRAYDAALNYEAVLDGRNPLGSAPLTPDIAATIESNFRRWALSGGAVFTK